MTSKVLTLNATKSNAAEGYRYPSPRSTSVSSRSTKSAQKPQKPMKLKLFSPPKAKSK